MHQKLDAKAKKPLHEIHLFSQIHSLFRVGQKCKAKNYNYWGIHCLQCVLTIKVQATMSNLVFECIGYLLQEEVKSIWSVVHTRCLQIDAWLALS